MRRAMSAFDLWFYGVVGFIVLTASMALAFAIAITGPPTDEELDGLSAALGRASHDAAVLAQQVGEEACVQLPPEVTSGLCPSAADPDQPTLATEDVAYEPYPTVPERETQVVDESVPVAPAEDLLGDVERAEPRAPRAERRARVEPRRERRRVAEVRPRSIQRAEVDLVQPLPSAEAGDVVAMQPAVETEIAPEGIAEATVYERDEPAWDEAEEARYDPYDDRYDRQERYADEDDAYDEDEYRERRERRRERRRQRQDQYYGGW